MDAMTSERMAAMPIFSALTSEQRDQLLQRHRLVLHAPEQVFVLEQDWGESVFLICSGMAKVRTFSAEGEEVVMCVLGDGELFGEMAVLDGGSRSADVVALTPVTLVRLSGACFSALLQTNAGFALALARLEAGRLRDLNQRFVSQASDATTRVLGTLAYLARRASAQQDPTGPIPPLAQRELAVIAGLARETASRTLSKLRSRGTVVEVDGCLRIADLQPLVRRGLVSQSS
jgi:CRP-like cAMP-binding protein